MSEANYTALYGLAKEWLKTQEGGLQVAAILPLATELMANAQTIFGPNRGAEEGCRPSRLACSGGRVCARGGQGHLRHRPQRRGAAGH